MTQAFDYSTDDDRARMVDVLVRGGLTYPELELRIAWNQPLFTHHGTYIIGSRPRPSTWR